jgi:hypothetical protein
MAQAIQFRQSADLAKQHLKFEQRFNYAIWFPLVYNRTDVLPEIPSLFVAQKFLYLRTSLEIKLQNCYMALSL